MTTSPAHRLHLKSMRFTRFKALLNFSISLDRTNILVGPNNCGKSTIIGALRTLAVAMRSARSRSTEFVRIKGIETRAYRIPPELISISLENVHTNYADEASTVDFRFTNGNQLQLYFPPDGGCILIPISTGRQVTTAAHFKQAFPFNLVTVPALGPVEHDESILEKATVQRNLETHRAPRHFRNYWHHFADDFEEFKQLVAETWPGMSIVNIANNWQASTLSLFCCEGRIDRELFWAGSGFQVWCQLITHIIRAKNADLLVIDEPEVYLHPEVQRQLLEILRRRGLSVILATHSTEILGEAEPAEILAIDKAKRRAERLRDVVGTQEMLDVIGSIHNITLASIARHGKILFVENEEDFKLIRRFAARAGYGELASGLGIAAVPSEGFGNWEKVAGTGWGLARVMEATSLQVGIVLDRDYRSQDEIDQIESKLRKSLALVVTHRRKEIENYLLVVPALARALGRELPDDQQLSTMDLATELLQITDKLRDDVFGAYIGKATEFAQKGREDAVTVATRMQSWLSQQWSTLDGRLTICPGKEVLRDLRTVISIKYRVSLTSARIVAAMTREEIPAEMSQLLEMLDGFRSGDGKQAPESGTS